MRQKLQVCGTVHDHSKIVGGISTRRLGEEQGARVQAYPRGMYDCRRRVVRAERPRTEDASRPKRERLTKEYFERSGLVATIVTRAEVVALQPERLTTLRIDQPLHRRWGSNQIGPGELPTEPREKPKDRPVRGANTWLGRGNEHDRLDKSLRG